MDTYTALIEKAESAMNALDEIASSKTLRSNLKLREQARFAGTQAQRTAQKLRGAQAENPRRKTQ